MFKQLFICLFLTVGVLLSCKKTPDSTLPPTLQAPVANAGADQTIMKPRSTALLSAILSPNSNSSLFSYRWTVVAGPNASNLDYVMGLRPYEVYVSKLEEGAYQFELTVTGSGGATARDTMNVTVLPDPLTGDPSRMKRFDSLQFLDSCTIRISNLSSFIPATGAIQVFLARYYGGGVLAGPFFPHSAWFQLQPVRSSGFWYEIKNDVLIVYAAAEILCGWDDGEYDLLLRWN